MKAITLTQPWATLVAIGAKRFEPGGFGVRGAEHERDFGDFTPGRYAWVLRDVEPNLSAPVAGRLGLWDAPCLSHNPLTDEICELAPGEHVEHRAGALTWNWGDS